MEVEVKDIDLAFLNLKENLSHKIYLTIILTIGWFWLYTIVHFTYQSTQLKYKTLLDTRNRIISIVHGIGSFSLACIAFPSNNFKYYFSYLVNLIANYSILSAFSHSHTLYMTLWLASIMAFGIQALSFIILCVCLDLALQYGIIMEVLTQLEDSLLLKYLTFQCIFGLFSEILASGTQKHMNTLKMHT